MNHLYEQKKLCYMTIESLISPPPLPPTCTHHGYCAPRKAVLGGFLSIMQFLAGGNFKELFQYKNQDSKEVMKPIMW